LPSTTEKVLILCRAIPEESKKYFRVVCVAGVNSRGELRRLYPVPLLSHVPGGGIPFHKKEWVKVNLSSPEDGRDKRPESRKVDIGSVKVLRKADDDEVRRIIKSNFHINIKSIEEDGASLGFIRPKIIDYELGIISTSPKDEQAGGSETLVKLKQQSSYRFVCQMRQGCSCENQPHHMIIHDWEVNELYRNVIARDSDPDVIFAKMKEKMFGMMKEKDTYFMMGTHHRWKVWLIVSLLYLRPH
jgi:hypothetical protein